VRRWLATAVGFDYRRTYRRAPCRSSWLDSGRNGWGVAWPFRCRHRRRRWQGGALEHSYRRTSTFDGHRLQHLCAAVDPVEQRDRRCGRRVHGGAGRVTHAHNQAVPARPFRVQFSGRDLAARGTLWPLLRTGATWFTFGTNALVMFRVPLELVLCAQPPNFSCRKPCPVDSSTRPASTTSPANMSATVSKIPR
jgi:hypothetical protein